MPFLLALNNSLEDLNKAFEAFDTCNSSCETTAVLDRQISGISVKQSFTWHYIIYF